MSGARINFGFIPFPLEIVDDGIDLSLSEYRLLGYLLRHRFRVKSELMKLSQDELLCGVKAPNGERRDRGCLITSGRDLKAARERLISRGWLRVSVQPTTGLLYELCLDGVDDASANCTEPANGEASANCPDSQCNLSFYPVQIAPAYKEEKVKKAKKVSCADGTSDPRHVLFRDSCKKYAEYKNVQFIWNESEGKVLSDLLKAAPDLDLGVFQNCLRNRAKSDGVTDGSRPRVYLPTITKYQQGPLDQFGNLKGSGDGTNQNGSFGRSASRAAQNEHEQFEGIIGAFAGLIADGAR